MDGLKAATPEEIKQSGLSTEQLSIIQQENGKELLSIELQVISSLEKSTGISKLSEQLEASSTEKYGIAYNCLFGKSADEQVEGISKAASNKAAVLFQSNNIHCLIESSPLSSSSGLQIVVSSGFSEVSRISISPKVFTKENNKIPVANQNIKQQDITFDQPTNLKSVAQQLIFDSSCQLRLQKTSNNASISAPSFDVDGQKILLSLSGSQVSIVGNEYPTGLLGAAVESILQIAATGHQAQSISAGIFIPKNDINQIQQLIDAMLPQLLNISQTFHVPISGLTFSIELGEVSIQPICAASTVGLPHPEGNLTAQHFQSKGDLIFLLGENPEDVKGSRYAHAKQPSSDTPYVNTSRAKALQQTLNKLTNNQTINAAKICATGGIYLALLELSLPKQLGFDIVTDAEIREDAFLFGEAYGRAIITVNEDNEDDFIEHMMKSGVTFTLLGHVTQGKMVVDDEHYGFSKDVAEQLKK